jgi:hypothetical protein
VTTTSRWLKARAAGGGAPAGGAKGGDRGGGDDHLPVDLVGALPAERFARVTLGALAGFATGLGWAAMSLASIAFCEPPSLRLSNSGCQILSYTLMGALIGGWK